jgi:hypothetical protein
VKPPPPLVLLLAPAVSAIGCQNGIALDAPLDPDHAGLLLLGSGRDIEGRALPAGAPLPPITLRIGQRAILLELPRPLGAYRLSPGAVELRTSEGRPLPRAVAVHTLTAPEARWRASDRLPEDAAALRLPALEACECRTFFEDRLVCAAPCPSPAPPAPAEAPRSPEPPELSCPSGWSRSGLGPCVPPPSSTCETGQWQPLGAEGCVPLRPCPDGGDRFRVPAGVDGLAFIDPAAPPGGAGTRARPFASVAEALTRGRTALALAPGRHPPPPALPDGTRLFGACPGATVLEGPVRAAAETTVTIDGVRIASPTWGVEVAGRAILRGVVVEGARGGVRVSADAELRASAIRVEASTGAALAASGATLEIQGATLRAARSPGSSLARGASARLGATRVEAGAGAAVVVDDSALRLAEAALESPRGAAVLGAGASSVRAETLYVRGGRGADLSGEATLEAEGLSLESSDALLSARDDAQVTVTDLVARSSAGFTVADAAELRLRRARVTRPAPPRLEPLVVASGAASVRLSHVIARGGSAAISMRGTGALEVRRAELDGGIDAGTFFAPDAIRASFTRGPLPCRRRGADGAFRRREVTLQDVRLHGARSGPPALVALCPGTSGALERVHLEGGRVGLFSECRDTCVGPARVASVRAADLVVERATQAGILQRGGELTLERGRVERAGLFGVYAWGSRVEARSLEVTSTGTAAAAAPPSREVYCTENRSGRLRGPASAVFVEAWRNSRAFEDGQVDLDRFALRGSGCAGLSTGVNARVSAARGRIESGFRGINYIRDANPRWGPEVVLADNVVDVFRIKREADD